MKKTLVASYWSAGNEETGEEAGTFNVYVWESDDGSETTEDVMAQADWESDLELLRLYASF